MAENLKEYMSETGMLVKRQSFADSLHDIAAQIETDESYGCDEVRDDLLGCVDYLYCKSFEDEEE